MIGLWLSAAFALGFAPGGEGVADRRVALTFDDLPAVSSQLEGGGTQGLAESRAILAAIVNALRTRRAPAIGFVNESQLHVHGELDARTALLEDWLDAGHELGNHTFSHLSLQRTPLAQYQDDVIKGEAVTRRLLQARGKKPRYFRHPYTSTGPTAEVKAAFERFLADRGYRVAPFTVEHADYAFNRVYVRALAADDHASAAKVKQAYLDHLGAMFAHAERLSGKLFDREIPQVFLVHANRLNADCLEAMLARLAARGYRFISLDEAMKDQAYRTPDRYVGPMGISWLHRWSLHLGVPVTVRNGREFPGYFLEEPDPPQFIIDAMKRP